MAQGVFSVHKRVTSRFGETVFRFAFKLLLHGKNAQPIFCGVKMIRCGTRVVKIPTVLRLKSQKQMCLYSETSKVNDSSFGRINLVHSIES